METSFVLGISAPSIQAAINVGRQVNVVPSIEGVAAVNISAYEQRPETIGEEVKFDR